MSDDVNLFHIHFHSPRLLLLQQKKRKTSSRTATIVEEKLELNPIKLIGSSTRKKSLIKMIFLPLPHSFTDAADVKSYTTMMSML